MIEHQSDINASASTRVEGLEVLAVLPGMAHHPSKEAALYINHDTRGASRFGVLGEGSALQGSGNTLFAMSSLILTSL